MRQSFFYIFRTQANSAILSSLLFSTTVNAEQAMPWALTCRKVTKCGIYARTLQLALKVRLRLLGRFQPKGEEDTHWDWKVGLCTQPAFVCASLSFQSPLHFHVLQDEVLRSTASASSRDAFLWTGLTPSYQLSSWTTGLVSSEQLGSQTRNTMVTDFT